MIQLSPCLLLIIGSIVQFDNDPDYQKNSRKYRRKFSLCYVPSPFRTVSSSWVLHFPHQKLHTFSMFFETSLKFPHLALLLCFKGHPRKENTLKCHLQKNDGKLKKIIKKKGKRQPNKSIDVFQKCFPKKKKKEKSKSAKTMTLKFHIFLNGTKMIPYQDKLCVSKMIQDIIYIIDISIFTSL